ncbi:hypothetical protein [Agromyces silvae]|uniref:hypothetical protein n=1 Tax=Agromyces silvae TaxID=3388266 RepID=UPI00280B3B83|nr:hypothetical protein [Agromyces protaetiae]
MSDPLRPEGEYTDSDLPLDAELPTEEYEEVEEALEEGDDVEVIEVVDLGEEEPGGSVPN